MFNFSILKDIDFTNPEIQIFSAIFLVIIIAIIFIFVVIIKQVIRLIKRLVIKIFAIDARRPKFNQENTDWLHEPQDIKKNIVHDNIVNNPATSGEKPEEKETPVPRQKIVGGDFTRNLDDGEKNGPKAIPEKDSKQKYEEKEQKDITASLGKLKGINQPSPEEQGVIQKISLGSTIKIPTSEQVVVSSNLHGQKPTYEKEKREAARRTVQPQSKGPAEALGTLGVLSQTKVRDDSIFGGAPEVSREKLKQEMEEDPKVWQAARQEGLTLSPIERAKLVKEVFAPELGANISKTDLKISIKKLNQKLSSEKNPVAHAKIREEIKFFKKIGGIK